MIRFRYSGNGWRVAASLRTLLVQVETHWPTRHPTDGTIASSSHTKWPASDHGRDPAGIVRAGDVGEVEAGQMDELGELLRLSRDSRIKYVIHDRRMFSSYRKREVPPFTWRDYTGSNLHSNHLHISVVNTADNDIAPWKLWDEEEESVITQGQKGPAVRFYQEALLAWNPKALPQWGADGDFGEETIEWVGHFQEAYGLARTRSINGVIADLLGAFHPSRTDTSEPIVGLDHKHMLGYQTETGPVAQPKE